MARQCYPTERHCALVCGSLCYSYPNYTVHWSVEVCVILYLKDTLYWSVEVCVILTRKTLCTSLLSVGSVLSLPERHWSVDVNDLAVSVHIQLTDYSQRVLE